MAPFSEKLGRIRDNKKFMTAISKDMMRSVIARDVAHYRNIEQETGMKDVPLKKEEKKRSKSGSSSSSGEYKDKMSDDSESKRKFKVIKGPELVEKKPFT